MVRTFLFEHRARSPDAPHVPIALWEGQADLRASKACPGTDGRTVADGGAVFVPRYEIRNVELPDWMDPGEWARAPEAWDRAWALGLPLDWPEARQRKLIDLPPDRLLACLRLLGRHRFGRPRQAGLRERLDRWLESPGGGGPPFTFAEWAGMVTPKLWEKAYGKAAPAGSGRKPPPAPRPRRLRPDGPAGPRRRRPD